MLKHSLKINQLHKLKNSIRGGSRTAETTKMEQSQIRL